MSRLPDDLRCPDCGGPKNDCDWNRIQAEDILIDNAGSGVEEIPYRSGGAQEDYARAWEQKRMLDRG